VGSKCQCVVGGTPLLGIVDSIMIMGSTAFKQVASIAWKSDKIPRNYNQQPFHVDGMIVIDIEFQHDHTSICEDGCS